MLLYNRLMTAVQGSAHEMHPTHHLDTHLPPPPPRHPPSHRHHHHHWPTPLHTPISGRLTLKICLTHWGLETHICAGNLTIICSDNGLSPGRRQAIIETNVGILFIGTLGTDFSKILFEKYIISFKKMHFKVSSGNWRPFCLGLNVLNRSHESRNSFWHYN